MKTAREFACEIVGGLKLGRLCGSNGEHGLTCNRIATAIEARDAEHARATKRTLDDAARELAGSVDETVLAAMEAIVAKYNGVRDENDRLRAALTVAREVCQELRDMQAFEVRNSTFAASVLYEDRVQAIVARALAALTEVTK